MSDLFFIFRCMFSKQKKRNEYSKKVKLALAGNYLNLSVKFSNYHLKLII